MNRNLQTLKIKEIRKFDNKTILGTYSSEKNEILIKKNQTEDVLSHEFLHMCASNKTSGSGFHIKKNLECLGKALNEGYTSLLDVRIFHKNIVYLFECRIAFIIERIIGNDKMTKHFFENDLYNLIEDLSKYQDEEKIKIMLKYMNLILRYKNLKNKKKKKYQNIIINAAKKVNECIDEIILNYLNSNALSDIEKIKLIEDIDYAYYYNYIDESLNSYKNNINILNEETYKQIKNIQFDLLQKELTKGLKKEI